MNMSLDFTPALLKQGSVVGIGNAEGKAVVVLSGLVWITQEGDSRDIFLAGRQSRTIDRPGLVVVEAIQDSCLLVREAENAAAAADERAPA